MEMKSLGACSLSVSAIGLGHSMGADDFSAIGKAVFVVVKAGGITSE